MIPNYEWIPFSLPLNLEPVDPEDIHPGTRRLKVSRLDDLSLAIRAEIPSDGAKPHIGGKAGVPIDGRDIELRYQQQYVAKLGGFYETEFCRASEVSRSSLLKGDASYLTITYSANPAATTVDWLANVPNLLYPRGTERTQKRTHTRTRQGESWSVSSRSSGSYSDYAQFELNHPNVTTVRFGRVPKKFAQSEPLSGYGFVEYVHATNKEPCELTRRSIRRALEFLFGRGIAHLGTSTFDKKGGLVRAMVQSAFVAGGMEPAMPPSTMITRAGRKGQRLPDEDAISKFVNPYLDQQEQLSLNHVVGLHLSARNASSDVRAVYQGSAFDALRSRFLRDHDSPPPTQKPIPHDQWISLEKQLKTVIESFTEEAECSRYRDGLDSISNSVGNLNCRDSMQNKLSFLDHLGLEFGDYERAAFKARNAAAHGDPICEVDLWDEPDSDNHWTQATFAMQTLFARVLFAILEVEVEYRDYSVPGWPTKPLREKQG
jgi:hypothetical protein